MKLDTYKRSGAYVQTEKVIKVVTIYFQMILNVTAFVAYFIFALNT